MNPEYQKPSVFSAVSSKYFLLSVLYCIVVGISVTLTYEAWWNPLRFDLTKIFSADFTYLFVFLILVPSLVFSLILHFNKRKAGLGIGIIFVVLLVILTILGATTFSGEGGLGLIYLVQFMVMLSAGAGILGWIARGFLKINKIVTIAIIILIPILFLGATFLKVYNYQVQGPTALKCEELNTYAQIDCYNQLARSENNWSICEQINGADNIREDCLKTVWTKDEQRGKTIDSTECANLKDRQQILCYDDVALKTNNQLICNNIPDNKDPRRAYLPSDRENCISQVKQSGPAQVGDIMACEKLGGGAPNTNYPEVRNCIYQVIQKAGGEPSICAPLPNNLLDRDNCYTWAAVMRKDIGICKNTQGTSGYDYCVKQLKEAR